MTIPESKGMEVSVKGIRGELRKRSRCPKESVGLG